MSHSPRHSISSTHSPSSEDSEDFYDAAQCLSLPQQYYFNVVEFILSLLSSLFTLVRTFFGMPSSEQSREDLPLSEQSREDLENIEEFFDLESLSPSSEDFFQSQLSEEEFRSVSETLSNPPEAAAEETPEAEIKRFPRLIICIAVIHVGIFIIIMYINNCTKHTFPTTTCFPHFLGRLSFQPTGQNPLYGPSRETLIKMGGLYLRKVLHMHQAWRLFSNIWLHEGFTQLLTDIVTLCGVGIELEQQFGFVRVGLLYLISGLGGSLVSALFIQSRVTVGASGALAGLAGGSISKTFIEYWTLHLPMGFDLSLAVVMLIINVVVTIVQHGDNFANLGGSIVGVLFGFVIFTRPPVNRLRCSALLIVTFVGLFIGMMMVLKGVNLNDHCSWCHYLDCIPFPGWSCKFRGTECESNVIGNLLSLTCKGNGRTGMFPLVNDNPPEPIEELCYRLCQ